MELLEAIKERRSIRGFKPDPVPPEVLRKVLEAAIWSPSAHNSQPWEFFVLVGNVLEEIKRANAQKFRSGESPHPDIGMQSSTGPYRERQIELAKELFRLLDIPREDKEKRRKWAERNIMFYDAPAAIIIAVDESAMGSWTLLDVGIVAQTISLAALEYNLGTCIQISVVYYPEEIRRIARIPDSKKLILGIAIGYPDWDYPANKLRSKREPLEKLLTWCGKV